MIDLRLFRNRMFTASLVINLISIFVAVGYFLFVAQYLQLVLGLSPLHAGLWSVPSAGGFIIGSQLAPRIVRRVRPAAVIGAGLALSAIGLVMLTQVGGSVDLALLVIASVVISLGLAPVLTLTTDLIVGSAPPERAGAASGISETGAELGGALGLSILGSVGVAVYRGALGGGLPAAIPAETAAIARDTLGAAVAVAEQLPDELRVILLDVARDAFIQGVQVTAAISAVVAAAVAVLAVIVLRGHGVPTADAETSEPETSEPETPLPGALPDSQTRVPGAEVTPEPVTAAVSTQVADIQLETADC
jgi:DHA2 family multidrug resistance protein-like MFS transporter